MVQADPAVDRAGARSADASAPWAVPLP